MDEPQQIGEDSPCTLVLQIAACPAAIEGLSKAFIPSLLVSLEVIIPSSRNDLKGNEGEHNGKGGQWAWEMKDMMMMMITTQGVPILGTSVIRCRNSPVQPNVIRAMQLRNMTAIQPSNIRAMQLNTTRAMCSPAISDNAAIFHMSNAVQPSTSTAVDQHQ